MNRVLQWLIQKLQHFYFARKNYHPEPINLTSVNERRVE